MKLQTTIGLEIHCQLKTKSKMFCSCDNASDDAEPNTHICPICLGHPGTLPTANKQAVLFTLKIGKALGSEFPEHAKFDRKNYFYPDLPKGYQISQYDQPFCKGGELSIDYDGKPLKVRFNRVHLEEDAAKLTHGSRGGSVVDFNRAGTPLAEMVTEPDLHSPKEAGAFLRELRTLLRYLGVSDADMEKGNMRCDANISIQDLDRDVTTKVVEIKNLNSFRSVERALAFEEERLSALVKDKREAEQIKETRGWSDKTGQTSSQRSKEEASDYRYFPEPDLPPVAIDAELLADHTLHMPELPAEKRRRFEEEYALDADAVLTLCADPALANFYEEVTSELAGWLEADGKPSEMPKAAKLASNWILAEVLKHLNAEHQDITSIKFTPENFADFIQLVFLNKVNSSAAQTILKEMYANGGDPGQIMENKDLAQMSDSGALEGAIEKAVSENPDAVADFKAGKEKALQFLIGQVMKETRGKANPGMLREIFERKLK